MESQTIWILTFSDYNSEDIPELRGCAVIDLKSWDSKKLADKFLSYFPDYEVYRVYCVDRIKEKWIHARKLIDQSEELIINFTLDWYHVGIEFEKVSLPLSNPGNEADMLKPGDKIYCYYVDESDEYRWTHRKEILPPEETWMKDDVFVIELDIIG